MKTFVVRLHPHQDLKEELEKFTKEQHIQAGVILTCVGSLRKARMRLADENVIKMFRKKFEVISLVGTLSQDGMHLHIALADEKGNAIGGHVKKGCIIYATAEIVIGELDDLIFSRKFDRESGFKELTIALAK